jgi:hypothetical protein
MAILLAPQQYIQINNGDMISCHVKTFNLANCHYKNVFLVNATVKQFFFLPYFYIFYTALIKKYKSTVVLYNSKNTLHLPVSLHRLYVLSSGLKTRFMPVPLLRSIHPPPILLDRIAVPFSFHPTQARNQHPQEAKSHPVSLQKWLVVKVVQPNQ